MGMPLEEGVCGDWVKAAGGHDLRVNSLKNERGLWMDKCIERI